MRVPPRLRFLLKLLSGELVLAYDRMEFSQRADLRRTANRLLARLEGRLQVRRPHSYPLGLQLEPTIHCQLDCPHCPRIRATDGMSLGHMEWESYERLMREIGPYLGATAFWQWGEPLTHPRITDMVSLAKSHGMITLMSTNAQADPSSIDIRALVEALDMLIISMDGASQEVYQSFRAGGSLDRLKDFVQAVVQVKRESGSDVLINVRVVATRDNEAEIEDVSRFAAESGADLFSVKSVSLYYDDDPSNPSLPKDGRYRSSQYQGPVEAEEYRRMPNYCRKPWAWPTLRYDGTLLFCECDHRMIAPLGNVFSSGSFREVWGGAQAADLRRRYGSDGNIDLEFCQRCRYKLDDAIRRIDRYDAPAGIPAPGVELSL